MFGGDSGGGAGRDSYVNRSDCCTVQIVEVRYLSYMCRNEA